MAVAPGGSEAGCGPTLACDHSAQPGPCSLPGHRPSDLWQHPLALSGRAHLEGQALGSYWVLRVSGTKKVPR